MIQVEDIMSDTEIEVLGNTMKGELRICLASDTVHDSISEFCSIPIIHEHIRVIDRNSYEPIMLSIGPYHNGSPALSSMEREKWNCLDNILKLNCAKGLKDYLTILNGLETRARLCYSGDVKMNKRNFLQTLLLDGCFVLVTLGGYNEFITSEPEIDTASSSHAERLKEHPTCGHQKVTARDEIQQTHLMNHNATRSSVLEQDILNFSRSREENLVVEIESCLEISGHQKELLPYQDNTQQIGRWYDFFVAHDLLLLENQIPFFVVEGIYEVVISNKMAPTTSRTSVARYIEKCVPLCPTVVSESSPPKDFDHLLHLLHMYFRPSSSQDEHDSHTAKHYIHHLLAVVNFGSTQDGHFPNRWRRATQYHDAGIEFTMRTYSERDRHSLLDIKLRNGVMEIPFLLVDEKTSFIFRNFIALEQTCPQVGNDVTAYIVFMAQLMSMPDDVALLARKGVIAHHMRTDRDVSQIFTKLTKGVVFDFYGNYYLKHLCLVLEAHYQNRLHRWIAWLKHNQFGNPWLAVAGLAGVIVLFCTVAQTVLTVLSYVDPK